MSSVIDRTVAEGRDELTADEARAYTEEQTMKYFGLGVDEFIRRAEEGTLPEDDPMVVHLALLTGARLHSC